MFQSIPDNLLGLMVGDWLDHKRRRHLAVLEANTAHIVEGIAIERLTEPSPSILIPLMQAAVDEGRSELQGLWAALLANAMVDGGRKVRRDFFEAVKRMEPADALILTVASEIWPRVQGNTAAMASQIRDRGRQLGMSDNDVQISIDALVALRCFWLNSSNQPIVTAFGSALLDACRPPA